MAGEVVPDGAPICCTAVNPSAAAHAGGIALWGVWGGLESTLSVPMSQVFNKHLRRSDRARCRRPVPDADGVPDVTFP